MTMEAEEERIRILVEVQVAQSEDLAQFREDLDHTKKVLDQVKTEIIQLKESQSRIDQKLWDQVEKEMDELE